MNLIIALLVSLSAAAGGNDVGNGGDALVCKTSIRLFDYYEQESLKRGDLAFAQGKDEYVRSEALIRRLAKVRPQLEQQYLRVHAQLKSRLEFLENADFRDVKDSFEVALPTDCKLEQLAIQQDVGSLRKIRISKKLWERLSVDDRAGLLLHEIIYEHFTALGETNSVKARRLNSYLASTAILTATPKQFQKIVTELRLPLY